MIYMYLPEDCYANSAAQALIASSQINSGINKTRPRLDSDRKNHHSFSHFTQITHVFYNL